MDEATRDSASTPSVLVGIPAYNEQSTVGDVVEEARDHADEVLVVDDGSEDRTPARARAAGATLVAHGDNRGYGATLGTIFEYAHDTGVDHLVILDADGQHAVADVPDLVEIQRETGAQLVTGSRFEGGSSSEIPPYRRFGLAVVNILTNVGLRIGYAASPVSDTQCGFRAYDREAIATMANTADVGTGMGASLDVLFAAAREGYDVVEIPTKIDYDVDNASTRNPIVHGFDLVTAVFLSVFRDRPARMTSVLGAIVLSGAGSLLALGLVGTTVIYLLVPAVIAVVLALAETLTTRPPRRSDRTDQ